MHEMSSEIAAITSMMCGQPHPAEGKRTVLNIGPQMKRLRLERGVTHRQLAAAAQVTIGTISRIENGKHEPSASIMAAIADFLGVTMDQLREPRETKPSVLEAQLIEAARKAQMGDVAALSEMRRIAMALGDADARHASEAASIADEDEAERRKGR